MKNTGTCLCKAVSMSVENMEPKVGACHCNTCRKWCGGPNLAIDCGTEVVFEGEEFISVYASSEWAERGFCKQCGTHLFYRLKQNQKYIIEAGVFDHSEGFVFDHQIFVDQRPDYYAFSNQTHDLTGAEVFAQYGG